MVRQAQVEKCLVIPKGSNAGYSEYFSFTGDCFIAAERADILALSSV